MGLTWAEFITNLDPNAGLQESDLQWPPYTRQGRQRVIFNGTGAWVDRDESRQTAWDYINSIQEHIGAVKDNGIYSSSGIYQKLMRDPP